MSLLRHVARASTLQPTFLVAEELADGRLVQVMPEYQAVELGIYLVYPSRKLVLPKVRVLVDFLSREFANVNWQHIKKSNQLDTSSREKDVRS